MSLINQMLKDLEQRLEQNHKPQDVLSGLHVALAKRQKQTLLDYSVRAGFVMSILFLLMTLIHYFHIKHHSVLPAEQALVAHKSATKDAPSLIAHSRVKPIAPIHLTPAIVSGITLQVDGSVTHLSFSLSQDVLYRVDSAKNNTLILSLEHTRLITSMPVINTLNSGISHVGMLNQANGTLKIILTLNPGVEISRLTLNNTAKLPEIQVDLISLPQQDLARMQASQSASSTIHVVQPIKKLRYDMWVDDEYRQALQYSAAGHTEEAIVTLEEVLAKDAGYQPARETLASLLLTEGNTTEALRVLQIGLQQRPYYPAYVLLKARALVMAGHIRQALNLLQVAPPSLAANPEYHAFIAALYQRSGQPLMAERLYEQLLALDANKPTWWIGLGIARESDNKPNEALQAYLRANNNTQLTPELRAYVETRISQLQG